MDQLEQFRGLVEEIANELKIGFCINNEPIDSEDFFDFETGLPIACLAGLDLARSNGWPENRMFVVLELNDDHPAYCSIEFNQSCIGYEKSALLSTVATISYGLELLSTAITPRFEQGGFRYLAIEDIGRHMKVVQNNQQSVTNSIDQNISEQEQVGAVTSVLRTVGMTEKIPDVSLTAQTTKD